MLSLQKQISLFKRTQWALIAIMLLIAGAFYLFVYRPMVHKQAVLDADIRTSHADLRGSRDKTSVLPSVLAEVDQLRKRVSQFKTVSRPHEVGDFLKEMEQLSAQASLKSLVIKEVLGPSVGRLGGRMNEKALDISFEGDFVSIYSFLRNSEDLQRLTRIPSLSIRSRDRRGTVRVAMKMNIYFQAE
jgi:Tfp pilus assembly protein PilO